MIFFNQIFHHSMSRRPHKPTNYYHSQSRHDIFIFNFHNVNNLQHQLIPNNDSKEMNKNFRPKRHTQKTSQHSAEKIFHKNKFYDDRGKMKIKEVKNFLL